MAASMKDEIESFCKGELSEAPKQLATEIQKTNSKFLEFIEQLGEFITSGDNVARGRATQLIGAVLEMLPPSFLSQEQVEIVATFLLAKLSDHHSVQPHALHTLSVLTKRYNSLPTGLPEQICQSIFREIQNQTLTHTDRRATYLIIQNLLGSSWKALKQMGGDFVIGFIQQMDAEKDPRNLVLCFSCAHFISTNIHLGPFAEEMFEVLGCYFPIDFTPPPNDPHGITKEELIQALRKCMAATPEFAEYCIPLLLEKMTSDLQSARLDAFYTLKECAPVYGTKGLIEFIGSITSSVKREVLMNLSVDLVDAARSALTAVYSSIAPPLDINTSQDSTITETIVELYQDISKYLDGSDSKKSCLAFSLCHAVASSSLAAFSTVVPLILPSLISHCSKDEVASEQVEYLKELKQILDIIPTFHNNTGAAQSLTEHLPALYTLYETLLEKESRDLQLESVKALTLLVTSKLWPSPDKGKLLIDRLVSKSVNVDDTVLRKELLLSLQLLVKEDPSLRPETVNSLLQITKSSGPRYAAEALVHCVADLDSFIKVNDFLLKEISQDITKGYFHVDTNSLSLIQKLLLLAFFQGSDKIQNIIDSTQSLSQLLRFQASDEDCVNEVVDKTALPLLRTAVMSTLQWTEETKDRSAAFMSSLRDVFKVISGSIKKSDVTKLWDKMQKLMLTGDTNSIDLPGDFKSLSPLKADSPWQQTRLLLVIEGFVVAGDIQAMIENREALFEATFRLALDSEDEITQLSSCRCMAAIMNKAPIGSQIQWLLEPIVERLKSVMAGTENLAARKRALMLFTWLTKALECRAHSATAILSSHLVSMLSYPDFGAAVAERIGFIVEDTDDIFTAKLKGTITPLYKQRFFTLNLKALLEGYHKSLTKDMKQNHLTAISHIMSNLPLQVMKPHFPKLVPLLLESLEQCNNTSHVQTLKTLCSAVDNVPDVIVPAVDSLIPRLLDLATADPLMRVRVSALKCLESMAALPSHTIVPHQAKTVRALASTLDDKKRLVRKQAVDTRSAWILLETTKD